MLRLVLGGVFLASAVIKIWDVQVSHYHVTQFSRVPDVAMFAQDVMNYHVPPRALTNLVAITLPWIELLAGGLLICGTGSGQRLCDYGTDDRLPGRHRLGGPAHRDRTAMNGAQFLLLSASIMTEPPATTFAKDPDLGTVSLDIHHFRLAEGRIANATNCCYHVSKQNHASLVVLYTSPSLSNCVKYRGEEYAVFFDESFFGVFWSSYLEGNFCYGAVGIPVSQLGLFNVEMRAIRTSQ